jgi:hypothetical protein
MGDVQNPLDGLRAALPHHLKPARQRDGLQAALDGRSRHSQARLQRLQRREHCRGVVVLDLTV